MKDKMIELDAKDKQINSEIISIIIESEEKVSFENGDLNYVFEHTPILRISYDDDIDEKLVDLELRTRIYEHDINIAIRKAIVIAASFSARIDYELENRKVELGFETIITKISIKKLVDKVMHELNIKENE